jgi:hypothetical protein
MSGCGAEFKVLTVMNMDIAVRCDGVNNVRNADVDVCPTQDRCAFIINAVA